jgi:hypothetical protein
VKIREKEKGACACVYNLYVGGAAQPCCIALAQKQKGHPLTCKEATKTQRHQQRQQHDNNTNNTTATTTTNNNNNNNNAMMIISQQLRRHQCQQREH